MAEGRPLASSEVVLARMKRQARENTKPELLVRKTLHGAGLRYRVHYPVPGQRRRKIDIAFTRAKVAVFVDGCFWHACPIHGSQPKANRDWWSDKLITNKRRDTETDALLEEAGWIVLRFWEHQDPSQVTEEIRRVIYTRLPGSCPQASNRQID